MSAPTSILAQGNVDHLKELQRLLTKRGVVSEFVQPPGGCGSG